MIVELLRERVRELGRPPTREEPVVAAPAGFGKTTLLAAVMGLIIMAQAYLVPWMVP